MLSVNRELIQLYWDIGRDIVERQDREGWGKNVVDRIADDIQKAFPGLRAFRPCNVWRMRAFYLAYRRESGNSVHKRVTELDARSGRRWHVADIPWGHNQTLLFKLKDQAQRLWYAAKTVEHGWSRAVLTVQIESDLFGRQGKAISNFAQTLPPPQSDLAQQSLKDPYLFDFLTLHDDASRTGPGTRAGRSHPKVPAGTRCRVCIRRSAGACDCRRRWTFISTCFSTI